MDDEIQVDLCCGLMLFTIKIYLQEVEAGKEASNCQVPDGDQEQQQNCYQVDEEGYNGNEHDW